MKSLVIAEKPSVARDIARVLHCSQKGNGTLEGKDYVVTWALGHLVTLADPQLLMISYFFFHLLLFGACFLMAPGFNYYSMKKALRPEKGRSLFPSKCSLLSYYSQQLFMHIFH